MGEIYKDNGNDFLYAINQRIQSSHSGSGSDRTIASVRLVTALAMLYIGRLVTCGIDCQFPR